MAKNFKETAFYKYMKEEIQTIIETDNDFSDITKKQIDEVIEELVDDDEMNDTIYFTILDKLRKKLYECN